MALPVKTSPDYVVNCKSDYLELLSCVYITLKKVENDLLYSLCTYDFKVPQLFLTRRKLCEIFKTKSIGTQKHIY